MSERKPASPELTKTNMDNLAAKALDNLSETVKANRIGADQGHLQSIFMRGHYIAKTNVFVKAISLLTP